jgi:ABC-type molybdenum transport system ATPase subunit/photorepair protein PhrA
VRCSAHLRRGAAPYADGAQRLVALVEFRNVSIRYAADSIVFTPPLSWMVRAGENWAVVGGNGTGKTTLVELITGENVLGYTQDIRLFGRRKGSGESVASIQQQLGVISTATHMSYADFADPEVMARARANGFARREGSVSTWEVVCSGFSDSIGTYKQPSLAQATLAMAWLERLGLSDLVLPPPARRAPPVSGLIAAQSPRYAAAAQRAAAALRPTDGPAARNFFHLSFGQQKLVLLCRAVVKKPRLLLLATSRATASRRPTGSACSAC